jgi:hypothetical protein
LKSAILSSWKNWIRLAPQLDAVCLVEAEYGDGLLDNAGRMRREKENAVVETITILTDTPRVNGRDVEKFKKK